MALFITIQLVGVSDIGKMMTDVVGWLDLLAGVHSHLVSSQLMTTMMILGTTDLQG